MEPKELLMQILEALTLKDRKEFFVKETPTSRLIIYEIKIPDASFVIGKKGITIKAIRHLFRIIGRKINKQIIIIILDEAPRTASMDN